MNDSLLSRFEATEAKVSKKRYVVEVSADERKRLEELIRKGKCPAKKQLKARVLLRADEIAGAVGNQAGKGISTVAAARKGIEHQNSNGGSGIAERTIVASGPTRYQGCFQRGGIRAPRKSAKSKSLGKLSHF